MHDSSSTLTLSTNIFILTGGGTAGESALTYPVKSALTIPECRCGRSPFVSNRYAAVGGVDPLLLFDCPKAYETRLHFVLQALAVLERRAMISRSIEVPLGILPSDNRRSGCQTARALRGDRGVCRVGQGRGGVQVM